ncbi:LLM class flavin-dependent oxidoreductase [Neorhizobium lilium]|uniref:LLM class flavin-dependent oxidoreductase n=1 Tax=Neorhizobium lilium TaxID=2503024 RepID=A0A444LNN5_9HYPH|nr:LLM class flavin-dependent oxidoreductase [Neorhizobium lilium]RWX81913.1 LLM class flavin-dependent oxidoreductase [Neorhizobium lilium]
MILGYSLTPFGHHPAAWQQAGDTQNLSFGSLLRQAASAEEAGFDFILLADRLGQRPAQDLSSVAVPFEPSLLASALATRTSRIGIVVAAATRQHEPYNLARRFASLDWISKGRGGWLVVPTPEDETRDLEYVDVVSALWDSWEDDAFLYDKAAGRFFDPAKMHVLNHNGPHFSVRGPLNVNRSPQGKPVVASMPGDGGWELAAKAGELLLLQAKTPEELVDQAGIMLQALQAAGRDRQAVRLVADIVPVIGDTAGTQPTAALHLAGTPAAIADRMQELAAAASLDGFTILPPTLDMAARFVLEVVPELKRRGLLGGQGTTLRERLGLARPAHPAARRETAR